MCVSHIGEWALHFVEQDRPTYGRLDLFFFYGKPGGSECLNSDSLLASGMWRSLFYLTLSFARPAFTVWKFVCVSCILAGVSNFVATSTLSFFKAFLVQMVSYLQ